MSYERDVVGEELARELARTGDWTGHVVVGLPKGGAVVGARVALELGVAYECVPVCRIGMPCSPQLTLGAIDPEKFNVNGSSLAAGHPFAATGGRIVATLAKLLAQKGSGRGLISICAAGGQGVVAILER